MIDVLSANRLAFLNPSGVTVEYSNDGGTTWKDYGADKSVIISLFSIYNTYQYFLGKNKSHAGENDLLRITIDTVTSNIYTHLNKFYIRCHQVNQADTWCTIDSAYAKDVSSFNTNAYKVPIGQYDNIINIADITTYGGYTDYVDWQVQKIRFTFGGGKTTGGADSFNLVNIFGFGKYAWNVNSTMAQNGHLYSYDSNMNATFPSIVKAPQFTGQLNGTATNASKVNSHTVNADVPSDAKFTDTTYESITDSEIESLF